ncbi:MAG: segregation/condensation protein A [bacterium]
MFTVSDEKFDGPLDLLLKLIENNKLDITLISLSKITDSYLERIENIQGLPEDIAEFVYIAAKLLYLKSRELLPSSLNQDDEQEIRDLEQDLIEYQKYKQAADGLSQILEKGRRAYSRRVKYKKTKSFVPPKDIDREKLWIIFNEILNKINTEKLEQKTYEKSSVTLTEMKEKLRSKIKINKKTSFKSLLAKNDNRIKVIVTFLAILELIKQKEIIFKQDNNFSDFIIYRVK